MKKESSISAKNIENLARLIKRYVEEKGTANDLWKSIWHEAKSRGYSDKDARQIADEAVRRE